MSEFSGGGATNNEDDIDEERGDFNALDYDDFEEDGYDDDDYDDYVSMKYGKASSSASMAAAGVSNRNCLLPTNSYNKQMSLAKSKGELKKTSFFFFTNFNENFRNSVKKYGLSSFKLFFCKVQPFQKF